MRGNSTRVLRGLALGLLVVVTLLGVAGAQTWTPLTHQPSFQASTALLLTDGTILVQQYFGKQVWKLTPDSSGSYVNGTWTQLANLPSGYAPLYYSSAVLPDGRVIFEGGEYNNGVQNWTTLGAIYDPKANVWTSVTHPSGWSTIGDAQNVVLPNGRFMLANCCTTQQVVFNPTTLTWTPIGTGKADEFDEEGWTLLPDGGIITVDANLGGTKTSEKFVTAQKKWISDASTVVELVDLGSHELGPAVLRPDGTVFNGGATAHTAIYTPGATQSSPGTWVAGPDFPKVGSQQLDQADAPSCLLPNGNVLADTSPGVFGIGTHFYEFDGTSFIAEPATPNAPNKSSYEGRMLLLPTGQVLYTDGSSDVEIYTPIGSAQTSWAPVITTAPTAVTHGKTYQINGQQFNGLSAASAYGDDATAATNYPLVRITNNASGHVFYAKTHNHSTMGVATKARPVSTRFDVPPGIETGASTLVVVANGIASNPVNVTVN
jgi:hypothetical protein